MFGFLKKIFGTAQQRKVSKFASLVKKINAVEETLHSLTDEQLKAKTEEFKQRIKNGETVDDILAKHDEAYMPPEVKAAMDKAKRDGQAAPHAPQGSG